MNEQMQDPELRRALQRLDRGALATIDLDGAEAALGRRLAGEERGPEHRPRLRLGRRPGRRLGVAAAAAAVLTGLAVVAPWQGAIPAAMASWTMVPTPISAASEAAIAERCLGHLAASSTSPDGAVVGGGHFTASIMERRGDWAFATMSSSAEDVMCLDRGDWSGGDYRAPAESASEWGLLIAPTSDQSPAPDGLVTTGIVENGLESGSWFYVMGSVGADVTGVTIHTGGATGDVEATVEDGRFAAWWPGTKDWWDSPRAGDHDVTLTLDDGRRIQGVMSDFVVTR